MKFIILIYKNKLLYFMNVKDYELNINYKFFI